MKKNNIIFLILLFLIVCFLGYKYFFDDPYLKRSITKNNVEDFEISESSGKNTKDNLGYFDVYNNSKDSLTEKYGGGEMEVVYPPNYIRRNYYYNGVNQEMSGKGVLEFKASKFEKYKGEKFSLTNGTYIAGKEIDEGKYKICLEKNTSKDILNLNIEKEKNKTVSYTIDNNKENFLEIVLNEGDILNIETFKYLDKSDSKGKENNLHFEKRLATMNKVKFEKS